MTDQPKRGAVAGGPKVWTEEELRGALDGLRGAASNLHMEIAGTLMHLRAHRKLAEMVEPMRKAWCALGNLEYLPPPESIER